MHSFQKKKQEYHIAERELGTAEKQVEGILKDERAAIENDKPKNAAERLDYLKQIEEGTLPKDSPSYFDKFNGAIDPNAFTKTYY